MRMIKIFLWLSIPMLAGPIQAKAQQKAYLCTAWKRMQSDNARFNLTYYSKVFLAGSKPDKYHSEFVDFLEKHYHVTFPKGEVTGYCIPHESPSAAQASLAEAIRVERSNARVFNVEPEDVEVEPAGRTLAKKTPLKQVSMMHRVKHPPRLVHFRWRDKML